MTKYTLTVVFEDHGEEELLKEDIARELSNILDLKILSIDIEEQ